MGALQALRHYPAGQVFTIMQMCLEDCLTFDERSDRLLILMAADDIVMEVTEKTYRPTAISLAFGDKDSTAYNTLMWS